MRRRVLTILAVGGVLVVLFGTRGRLGLRPVDEPGPRPEAVGGPETPALRDWREVGRLFRSSARADARLAEHAAAYQAGKYTTPEQLRAFADDWAALFEESSGYAGEAVVGLRRLAAGDADAAVRGVAAATADYLVVREGLHRLSSSDCRAYAAVWADVAAAGGNLDETTAEGRRVLDRGDQVQAMMARRAENEGRAEKVKFAELMATQGRVRVSLSSRYGVPFPELHQPTPAGGR